MKIVIDAVGVKHSGGATVLLDTLRAASMLDRIRTVTVLASPASLRQFAMPECDKLTVVDVAWAESSIGRMAWSMLGLEQHLKNVDFNALIAFTGIGCTREAASVPFIQQSLPYSRESLCRCPWSERFRMAIIRRMTRRAARAADHIVVQTEAMRDTISKAFGISPERISAHLPNAPLLPDPAMDSPNLESMRSDFAGGVLLYVGSQSPHKNLTVVAEGLNRMPKRPRWYATLPKDSLFCTENCAIGLGMLGRAELHAAYRYANVLVMPSLVETVGLPMLEAMRIGIPVLAADRPYAHAVCEDAAEFFDPLSPADFAQKAGQLLADSQRCAELVKRGRALVERRDAVDPYRTLLEKVIEVAESRRGRVGHGKWLSTNEAERLA